MMQPRSGGLLQVKTTDISRYSAWMLAALMLMALAACGEDKQPEEIVQGDTGPIEVTSVINEPKVGAPGDTLLFTAVVQAHSQNVNDFPVYEWTADGGTFVETDKQTVHWVAPANSGIFTIVAKVTNDVNSSTNQAVVFTSSGTTLVEDFAGQVDLIGTGPDFHFFFTPNPDIGVQVYKYVGGVESDAVEPGHSFGYHLQYSSDGTFVVHAEDSLANNNFTTKPRHIYVGDFASGTARHIDLDTSVTLVRDVFDYPAISPDDRLVAYQGKLQATDGFSPDLYNVYVYDLVANTRRNISAGYQYPRTFFPTFSTDGNWLVYVLDPDRTNTYELYGSPITAHVVDENPANAVRMTSTGGIVTGPLGGFAKPLMAWNPVSSVLAIVISDGLYFLETTATGSTFSKIDTPRPVELLWSADGSTLYASSGSVISAITTSGATSVLVEAAPGDNVRDMAYSPDGSWLAYRVGRGGGNWISVLDLGNGKLDVPVPVTPTTPNGDISGYRGAMSMKPAWTSANMLIYPAWGLSANNTPSLLSRDLIGLVD